MAQKLIAQLAPNPFDEAMVYAGLGDKQGTFDTHGYSEPRAGRPRARIS
jgi:hypothetical protein